MENEEKLQQKIDALEHEKEDAEDEVAQLKLRIDEYEKELADIKDAMDDIFLIAKKY